MAVREAELLDALKTVLSASSATSITEKPMKRKSLGSGASHHLQFHEVVAQIPGAQERCKTSYELYVAYGEQ